MQRTLSLINAFRGGGVGGATDWSGRWINLVNSRQLLTDPLLNLAKNPPVSETMLKYICAADLENWNLP